MDKYEQLKGYFKEYAGSDIEGKKDYETIIGYIEQEAEIEEAKPKYSTEQFNAMSYKERVELNQTNPEIYSELTGGK